MQRFEKNLKLDIALVVKSGIMSSQGGKIVTFFYGRTTHSIDEKSRVMLPKKYHEILKGNLYLVFGFDEGSIYLYTEEAFCSRKDQFENLNDLSNEERRLQRTFFSNVYDCTLDKQGRVLLPKDLMLRAGITKEVVIIGSGTHLEIWDKLRYEQAFSLDIKEYGNLADTVAKKI